MSFFQTLVSSLDISSTLYVQDVGNLLCVGDILHLKEEICTYLKLIRGEGRLYYDYYYY